VKTKRECDSEEERCKLGRMLNSVDADEKRKRDGKGEEA